ADGGLRRPLLPGSADVDQLQPLVHPGRSREGAGAPHLPGGRRLGVPRRRRRPDPAAGDTHRRHAPELERLVPRQRADERAALPLRPLIYPPLSMLSFGVTVLPDPPASRLVELFRLAEQNGFDYGWTYDSHVLWQEPYPLLTMAALNTSTIKL